MGLRLYIRFEDLLRFLLHVGNEGNDRLWSSSICKGSTPDL